MNRSSIKSKMVLLSILFLTVPLIVLGILSYQKNVSSLDELGKTNLRNNVNYTVEMASALNEQVVTGELSLEEAQERVKVAILGEKQADGTRPINSSFDLGENGYLFITDKNGESIAHPSNEGENIWDREDTKGNAFVQETIEKGLNGGGYTYYEFLLPGSETETAEKVNYTQAFEEWGWIVSAGTYLKDFNQPANEMLTLIIIVVGITLVVGIIIIYFFANRMSNPINEVTQHLSQLANGDLTQEPIDIKSKDEIGKLAESLNLLQERLQEIIQNVSATSDTLSSHSEELTQSAHEVKEGTNQIASTMQELATGAETQATRASDLSSLMNSFVDEVQSAREKGDSIESYSHDVLDMTKEGSQLMENSTNQMAKIDQIVQEAVQKVKGLDNQSQEISSLITVIKDVADQTNLLALNAAIEAARAGEHGQGFAVVADEVRKLAEQVSVSVTEITGIVTSIQQESSIVAESLQEGYKEVEAGTSQIETTGQTFYDISSAVKEMAASIQAISNNLSDIVTNSQEMNSSIEEIASISEQSAAGVEQTSATTEQTSSTMEEVAGSSEQLAELAEKLNGLVHEFKLRK